MSIGSQIKAAGAGAMWGMSVGAILWIVLNYAGIFWFGVLMMVAAPCAYALGWYLERRERRAKVTAARDPLRKRAAAAPEEKENP